MGMSVLKNGYEDCPMSMIVTFSGYNMLVYGSVQCFVRTIRLSNKNNCYNLGYNLCKVFCVVKQIIQLE